MHDQVLNQVNKCKQKRTGKMKKRIFDQKNRKTT